MLTDNEFVNKNNRCPKEAMFNDCTDVKEEPEWTDYCISEAQARAVRGPLTNPIASTDADTKTASKNDTDKERNSHESHYVKEESEAELQERAGLNGDANEENVRLQADFCSGASVKVEIKEEREESNVTAASQKPNIVDSRRDVMAINDVAKEVNRKRILQPDKEPVIIKKYTNNVKNTVIPKTISHQTTPYLGISPRKEDINETKSATANENNLQEVTNICKIVIINPEADQARKSLSQLKTHQNSNSEDPNKNKSLIINSIAHTETGRSLDSETLRSKGGTKSTLPKPAPQLPLGIFRPIQQNLSKPNVQHISVPISRLGNNVYVKPLNPANIVSISNPQSETVMSQPPKPAFKVFKPVTVLESPKLLSTVSGIHNLQPIPKLLNGTAPTLQSAAIPRPKSKHLTGPVSKSSEVNLQPNILNGILTLTPIMSSGTNKPPINLEGVPDGKNKIAVAFGASNTSATPVQVNSSDVPIHLQKIAPKPISKSTIILPTPERNDNHLYHGIEHNNGQLEIKNKPNIQVTTPNIQLTGPNIKETSHNIQRIFPKPISKLTANSPLQKPNANNLFHKIGHNDGQLEVKNKRNIQVTVPNIQPTSHNIQRIFPKHILKLTKSTQHLKENGNNLLHKVDVYNSNRLPEKSGSEIQLTTPTFQRIVPKPISKLITKSQIPKPNDNNVYDKINNNNQQSKEDNNASNIQLVKSELIDDSTISRSIIEDYQPQVVQNISSIRHMTPTAKPPHKPGSCIPNLVDNNHPRNNDCQREPNQTDPSYIQPLLLEYLHTTIPPPHIPEPFEKPINSVAKSNINTPPLIPFGKSIHSVAKSNINTPPLIPFGKPIHSVAKSNINPPPLIPFEKPINSVAKSNINTPPLIPFEKPIHSVAKSNINTPPLIPFEKPINSVAKSNIHPIPQKTYGRHELKSNLPLNCNTQPPHNVPILEDPAQPSNQHDDQLKPNLNLQPNGKTEASKKVPKLEDFLTPSYVKLDHMRKRTCKVCQLVYYDRKAFLDHTQTHFGIRRDSVQTDTKHIKCTCYCQKRFNTFQDLIKHIRRIHMPKGYYCDYCYKRLADKRSIINHIRTHTGERPYECSICKGRYRTETNLISHQAVHSQRDKKHCCPICDRPFHTVTALKNHSKIHSGLRPHVCDICKQTFVVKHHLKRHMDSHSGERRFSCEYCKKRFLRKSHISRHINDVHARKLKKRKLKRKRKLGN